MSSSTEKNKTPKPRLAVVKKWPTLPPEANELIVEQLTSFVTFQQQLIQTPTTNVQTLKPGSGIQAASTVGTSTQQCPRSSSLVIALKAWMCFGLNEVTRSLERDELEAVVIVCKDDVTPLHLLQHLVCLAAQKSVPLCPLQRQQQNEPTTSLSLLFELKNLMAIGFRKTQRKQCKNSIMSITQNSNQTDVQVGNSVDTATENDNKQNKNSNSNNNDSRDAADSATATAVRNLLDAILPKFPIWNVPWRLSLQRRQQQSQLQEQQQQEQSDKPSTHKGENTAVFLPLQTHIVTSSKRKQQSQQSGKSTALPLSSKQSRTKKQKVPTQPSNNT